MKATYNTKTGKVTISLTNLEVRQFRGTNALCVGEIIKNEIEHIIEKTKSK